MGPGFGMPGGSWSLEDPEEEVGCRSEGRETTVGPTPQSRTLEGLQTEIIDANSSTLEEVFVLSSPSTSTANTWVRMSPEYGIQVLPPQHPDADVNPTHVQHLHRRTRRTHRLDAIFPQLKPDFASHGRMDSTASAPSCVDSLHWDFTADGAEDGRRAFEASAVESESIPPPTRLVDEAVDSTYLREELASSLPTHGVILPGSVQSQLQATLLPILIPSISPIHLSPSPSTPLPLYVSPVCPTQSDSDSGQPEYTTAPQVITADDAQGAPTPESSSLPSPSSAALTPSSPSPSLPSIAHAPPPTTDAQSTTHTDDRGEDGASASQGSSASLQSTARPPSPPRAAPAERMDVDACKGVTVASESHGEDSLLMPSSLSSVEVEHLHPEILTEGVDGAISGSDTDSRHTRAEEESDALLTPSSLVRTADLAEGDEIEAETDTGLTSTDSRPVDDSASDAEEYEHDELEYLDEPPVLALSILGLEDLSLLSFEEWGGIPSSSDWEGGSGGGDDLALAGVVEVRVETLVESPVVPASTGLAGEDDADGTAERPGEAGPQGIAGVVDIWDGEDEEGTTSSLVAEAGFEGKGEEEAGRGEDDDAEGEGGGDASSSLGDEDHGWSARKQDVPAAVEETTADGGQGQTQEPHRRPALASPLPTHSSLEDAEDDLGPCQADGEEQEDDDVAADAIPSLVAQSHADLPSSSAGADIEQVVKGAAAADDRDGTTSLLAFEDDIGGFEEEAGRADDGDDDNAEGEDGGAEPFSLGEDDHGRSPLGQDEEVQMSGDGKKDQDQEPHCRPTSSPPFPAHSALEDDEDDSGQRQVETDAEREEEGEDDVAAGASPPFVAQSYADLPIEQDLKGGDAEQVADEAAPGAESLSTVDCSPILGHRPEALEDGLGAQQTDAHVDDPSCQAAPSASTFSPRAGEEQDEPQADLELDDDAESTPELLPALHFASPSFTEELLSSPEFSLRPDWDLDGAEEAPPASPRSRCTRALSGSKMERTSIVWSPHESRYAVDSLVRGGDTKGKGKARAGTHTRGVSEDVPRRVEREVQTVSSAAEDKRLRDRYARLQAELRTEKARVAELAKGRDEAHLEGALSMSYGFFSWGNTPSYLWENVIA